MLNVKNSEYTMTDLEESKIDSYESGKSRFYICLETPMQVTNSQPAGSPIPPPRTRHNPFNRPDNNPHQRSHSLRASSSSNSGKHIIDIKYNKMEPI